jgi:hypothetical protein
MNSSDDNRRQPFTAEPLSWTESMKRLLPLGASADVRIPVANYYETQYYCDLYMGASFEKIQVVPDTGSSCLVVEGYECSSCLGNKYDYSNDAATFTQTGVSLETHKYGSAELKGYRATD